MTPSWSGVDAPAAHLAATVIDAAGTGGLVVLDGPIGAGVTTLLGELSAVVATGYAAVLSAAAAPGRLGMIGAAFGGTAAAAAVRAAMTSPDSDPLWAAALAHELGDWAAAEIAAGAKGPVLLLVDEVHDADPDSVAVLSVLARRPVPGFVVVAGGRQGRVTGLLAAACRAGAHVTVAPWSWVDVRRHYPSLGAARSRALHEAAAGRPAFVTPLSALPLADLRAVDRLSPGELALLLDQTHVRRWCSAERRPAAWRRVMAAAAASGWRIDAALVAAAAETTPAETLDVLLDAAGDGLIEDRNGGLQFVHPLLRAACYRLADPVTRTGLHARLAHLIGATADGDGTAAIEHLAGSGSLDPESVDAVLHACSERLPRDPRTAARWADLVRAQTGLPTPARVRADLVYAAALAAGGRPVPAGRLARDLMADPACTAAATVLAARCERLLGNAGAALALLTASSCPEAGEAALAEFAAAAADHPTAHRPPEPGAAAAAGGPRTGSPAAALLDVVRAEAWPVTPGGRAEVLRVATRVSAAVDALDRTAYGQVVEHVPTLAFSLVRLGQVNDAARLTERARHEVRHRPDVLARLWLVQALAGIHSGRLDSAEAAADEAAELASEAGLHRAQGLSAAAKTLISRLTRGKAPDRGEPVSLEQAADPLGRLAALTLARAHLLSDEHSQALDILMVLRHTTVPTGDRAQLDALTAIAEARLGHCAAALEALASARAEADIDIDRAAVAEAGAVVAATAGHAGDAVSHARAAVRIHAGMAGLTAEARCRLSLADYLGAAGDIEAAEREARLAATMLTVIGAHHLARDARAVQERLAAPRPRALTSGQFGLSAREAEIAQFVCVGMTNREIGARLFLSVRTVDTHVSRVLTKVGVTSRVALAHMFAEAAAMSA